MLSTKKHNLIYFDENTVLNYGNKLNNIIQFILYIVYCILRISTTYTS